MIRHIIKFFLKIAYAVLFRVKVIGKENIEDGKPYIICPNHISCWDPPLMAARLKRNDVYILAKEELYINAFVKWLAKKTNVLPVKRGKQDVSLLKTCIKVLKENHIVLLFPEGTRNGIEKRGKLQNGAVVMNLSSGAPIIPVGIQASYKLFSKVTVNIGKPMDFIEYKDKKADKETLDMLSNKLMEEIITLTKKEN